MLLFYTLISIISLGATNAYPLNLLQNPGLRLTAIQLPIQTQYHAQDELGQYSYGYNSPTSAKNEIRTADGITRGAYAYLDPNGLVQNVQYIADSSNGFRAAASNLPQPPVADLKPPMPVQDTAEVEQARLEHLKRIEESNLELLSSPNPPTTLQPPSAGAGAASVTLLPPSLRLTQFPILYPTIAYNSLVLPSASTQYHAQTEQGQYRYGFTNQISSNAEPRGQLAYIDPNGLIQSVKYIVNDINGIRALSADLPTSSEAQPQQGPTDTPEVQAAKQSLQLAQEEAKQRLSNNDQQSD
ncbi:uncharacterized protein LOC123290988 [Chrysoperla carnea]|uniref:uncharacterized protein LOC123290988 n=1 Tax=Chrysoperla carnea TaxID=189513 RepID=UPI001D05ECAC|nr:uncharacterized protein LOC123290988 [Chrysoperla carnea]